MLLLTWKGDAEEAARVLASGPTAARNEPRIIWNTALVQLCRRAPEDALRTLDRFAGDFIQDNWFAGPKAYLVGRAHALAGRTEAARLAFETALTIIDARLKQEPSNDMARLVRGQLLAFLGRPDEAVREARAVTELVRDREFYWFGSPALIYAALGRADDALPLLEKLIAPPAGQIVGWPLTPALLKLDPLWDKIRDDARFEKLVADAEARMTATRKQ
jgi:tetratricopeptide (TPR) repeat protein